jgi:hypothetical protein
MTFVNDRGAVVGGFSSSTALLEEHEAWVMSLTAFADHRGQIQKLLESFASR